MQVSVHTESVRELSLEVNEILFVGNCVHNEHGSNLRYVSSGMSSFTNNELFILQSAQLSTPLGKIGLLIDATYQAIGLVFIKLLWEVAMVAIVARIPTVSVWLHTRCSLTTPCSLEETVVPSTSHSS